jgi:hypothetical protein
MQDVKRVHVANWSRSASLGNTLSVMVSRMVTADARGPHLTLFLPVAALHVSTKHKVCLLQISDAS